MKLLRNIIIFCKENLISVGTAIAILAVPAVVLMSEMADIAEVIHEELYSGFALFTVMRGLEGRDMLLAFPLICALSGAAAFLRDRRSGMSLHILPRSGKHRYCTSRTIACGIVGGGVPVLGILLACIVSCLLLMSREPEFDPVENLYFLMQIMTISGMYFLSGFFWSVFGMLLSIITDSLYIAYLAPFAAYYLCTMLQQRYFPERGLLAPQSWIVPERYGMMDETGRVAIIAALMCTIAVTLTVITAERSLKDV